MRCDRQRSPAHLAAMFSLSRGSRARDSCRIRVRGRRARLSLAYPSIVTVRGKVLHNFEYVNTLASGQLLLLDGGRRPPPATRRTSHARGQ